MRIASKLGLFCLTLLMFSGSANACLGGYLRLNSTDGLTAEGIITSTDGLAVSVEEMKKKIISGRRATYGLTEHGTSKVTHRVEYLGTIADEGGVIQSSYLVHDVAANSEKVVVLQSSYRGNNVRARGLAPQGQPINDVNIKKRPEFKTLYSIGCGN
jgi:hypothetical protein